jgi:HNH endonuclease
VPVERTCPVCGRAYRVRPSDLARGRRTCSRACGQTGPRPARRLPLAERFWRHVHKTPTCWLWTGVRNTSGAGVLAVRTDAGLVRLAAPRVAWELHVGPIPPGHRLWHRCGRAACVRPDHLYLVRGKPAVPKPAGHGDEPPTRRYHHFASGRVDAGRTWWTRERVLDGLRRFYQATGQAPVASPAYRHLARARARSPRRRRYPSAYAILRHFPTLRAAWEVAGVQLGHRRYAPWTATDEWYVREALGLLPTATIAADLGRGEAAVRSRARKLGRRVTDAWGWPLLRVVRATGLTEHVLRAYVARGELPVLKGAKQVYIDPADLVVVTEIDWARPPAVLEAAVLGALRGRLLRLLAGRRAPTVVTPSRAACSTGAHTGRVSPVATEHARHRRRVRIAPSARV